MEKTIPHLKGILRNLKGQTGQDIIPIMTLCATKLQVDFIVRFENNKKGLNSCPGQW